MRACVRVCECVSVRRADVFCTSALRLYGGVQFWLRHPFFVSVACTFMFTYVQYTLIMVSFHDVLSRTFTAYMFYPYTPTHTHTHSDTDEDTDEELEIAAPSNRCVLRFALLCVHACVACGEV